MRPTLPAIGEFFRLEPRQREIRIESHPASSLPGRGGRVSGQGERAAVVSADATPKVCTKLRTGLRVRCKLPVVGAVEPVYSRPPPGPTPFELLADDAGLGPGKELRATTCAR
jgi:hypothetical protein